VRSKLIGLFTAIALLASAFAIPSTAAAESTPLCIANIETCSKALQVEMGVMKTVGENPKFLMGILGTVECQEALVAFAPEPKPETSPEKLGVIETLWAGCTLGNMACEVEDLALEELALQRTASNLGTLTWMGDELQISCAGRPVCKYGTEFMLQAEGSFHTMEAGLGMVTANEVPIKKTAGVFPCASTIKLDALFEFQEVGMEERFYITY
jgi:hypothetical protein